MIATLGDKRRLSEFIKEINKALPLPAFQHLKRVKNGQVLLFPVNLLPEANSETPLRGQVKSFLIDRGFPEELFEVCSELSLEEMTTVAPQLRSQFDEVIKRWPCKFHEDKALEKLSRNENFSRSEILFHRRMMRLCSDLGPLVQSECVALTFDPTRNEIVALGWRPSGDTRLTNILPSKHSVMRAIDNVALAQGGGAWREDQESLATALQSARDQFASFSDLHLKPADELKYGAYLCTGFDMYLTDEPCLMCSMAMVHSRVRRIFFRRNSVANGALGGGNQLKLHGVRELNHHFEVFRVNEEV